MAKVFITGSSDGLGKLAGQALIDQGHQVVLHARSSARADIAMKQTPKAEGILIADLSDSDETKKLAHELNSIGPFDAVIHNAGVYQVPPPTLFSVNTLAPYILTCLVEKPKRLIYLSSDMHMSGSLKFQGFKDNPIRMSYSDTKLHVLMLSMAVARKWPTVLANAVNPGWVPTKMGGIGAPDNLQKGFETQVWLASSQDERAKVTGQYFFHKKITRYHLDAAKATLQDEFLAACAEVTGIQFP